MSGPKLTTTGAVVQAKSINLLLAKPAGRPADALRVMSTKRQRPASYWPHALRRGRIIVLQCESVHTSCLELARRMSCLRPGRTVRREDPVALALSISIA